MLNDDAIKVSILCITYNQVDYIEDAINSFLMQKTNFNFEILIHDDASTDGTADVIQRYMKLYPEKIKAVLQTENQYSKGIKIVRNYLIPIAKGKYFAFCEGDDFWTDCNKLQKQFDYMEEHSDCSIYLHNGWVVSKDCKIVHNSKPLTNSPCIYGIEEAIKQLGIKVVTNSYFYRADTQRKEQPKFMQIAPTGDYGRVIVCALYGYIYYDPVTMSAHRAAAKKSLTEAWNKNSQRWKLYIERQMAMLDQLNIDTNYEYDEIIKEEKENQTFNNYVILKDKKNLSIEPYKSKYKQLSIKKRIQLNCPKLFSILQRVIWLFRKNKIKYVLKDLDAFKHSISNLNGQQ